jgi:hypothetical protein
MTRPDLKAIALRVDLYDLGEKLCHWHASQGDPIYAVGSYANTGKVHPSRETVERARDACERLRGSLPLGDEKGQDELDECVIDLNVILSHWPEAS